MLALISALAAGVFIFLRLSSPGIALVSVLLGYTLFVVYAYFRSRMWMKDPENAKALTEGRQPSRAVRIERLIASIVIPALSALILAALISTVA